MPAGPGGPATASAPDTSRWTRRLSLISDPRQQRDLGRRARVIFLASLVIVAGGVALVLIGQPAGWVLVVPGVLAAALWAALMANQRAVASFTGDDWIEVIVADEGLIVQAGLAVTWSEVALVEWSRSRITSSRRGPTTGDRIVEQLGADPVSAYLRIGLVDYRGVKRRTVAKRQRMVLYGPMLGFPGYLRVGLNGRTGREVAELVAELQRIGGAHGVRVVRDTDA